MKIIIPLVFFAPEMTPTVGVKSPSFVRYWLKVASVGLI